MKNRVTATRREILRYTAMITIDAADETAAKQIANDRLRIDAEEWEWHNGDCDNDYEIITLEKGE